MAAASSTTDWGEAQYDEGGGGGEGAPRSDEGEASREAVGGEGARELSGVEKA